MRGCLRSGLPLYFFPSAGHCPPAPGAGSIPAVTLRLGSRRRLQAEGSPRAPPPTRPARGHQAGIAGALTTVLAAKANIFAVRPRTESAPPPSRAKSSPPASLVGPARASGSRSPSPAACGQWPRAHPPCPAGCGLAAPRRRTRGRGLRPVVAAATNRRRGAGTGAGAGPRVQRSAAGGCLRAEAAVQTVRGPFQAPSKLLDAAVGTPLRPLGVIDCHSQSGRKTVLSTGR